MVYERQISSRGINMKEFFRLTRNALDTDNDETFLHSLIQRNALFGALEQFSSCLSQGFIEKMIFLEEMIIERLKTERKRIPFPRCAQNQRADPQHTRQNYFSRRYPFAQHIDRAKKCKTERRWWWSPGYFVHGLVNRAKGVPAAAARVLRTPPGSEEYKRQ